MRSHGRNLDIFDHDPARKAKAWRVQADESLRAFQFSEPIRLERYAYYTAQAEELERLAEMRMK